MKLNKQVVKNRDLAWITLKHYGPIGIFRNVVMELVFDLWHKTDTFFPIHEDELHGADGNERLRYGGSPFGLVRGALKHVEKDFDFTKMNLVDMCSGKGKVLIEGEKFPFRLCKGIEYNKALHKIAEANIAKLGLQSRIKLYNTDATSWTPEAEDRVYYFFNPFKGEMLRSVLKRITSKVPLGQRIVALYANPESAEIFDEEMTFIEEFLVNPGKLRVRRYEYIK